MSILARFFGHETETHYQRAMHAYNGEHYAQALSEFQLALDMTHQSSDPLGGLARFFAAESAAHLGLTALEAGLPSVAMDYFGTALKWNTHFPDLHYWTALTAVELGDFDNATLQLESVFAQDAEHFEAHWLHAVLLYQAGSENRASQELEFAREKAPSKAPGPLLMRVTEPLSRHWAMAQSCRSSAMI